MKEYGTLVERYCQGKDTARGKLLPGERYCQGKDTARGKILPGERYCQGKAAVPDGKFLPMSPSSPQIPRGLNQNLTALSSVTARPPTAWLRTQHHVHLTLYFNFKILYTFCPCPWGTPGGAVGWGTALQTGRSRFHWLNSFGRNMAHGFDWTSNRNYYH